MVDNTKCFHVVLELDSSTTRPVMRLLKYPPTRGKHDVLKAQLLWVFQLSNAEWAERLLSLNGQGGSKPTELMEKMLALFVFGDSYHYRCARLWPAGCSRAPRINVHTAGIRTYMQYTVHAMLPTQPRSEDGMMATVAAMAARREDDCELCFSHRRFGTKARRCIPPCFVLDQGNARASALWT